MVASKLSRSPQMLYNFANTPDACVFCKAGHSCGILASTVSATGSERRLADRIAQNIYCDYAVTRKEISGYLGSKRFVKPERPWKRDTAAPKANARVECRDRILLLEHKFWHSFNKKQRFNTPSGMETACHRFVLRTIEARLATLPCTNAHKHAGDHCAFQ